MKIEEGKYYRTRDGRKVGPAKLLSAKFGFWSLGESFGACHEADGTYLSGQVMPDDLVAEWADHASPVRTVPRQEIIPGTYDGVEVGPEVTGHPQREVMVRIATDHGPMVCMDHEALTRAAAVLTDLADALKASEAPR